MQQFQFGNWVGLLDDSQSCNARAHQSRRRDQVMDVEKRAARALSLVRQGELSSARMALEGAEVVPGNLATLLELTNPEKRPPRPRRDLSQEVSPQHLLSWTRSNFWFVFAQLAGGQQQGPLA